MVPGNHDVQWNAVAGEELNRADLKDNEALRAEFASYIRSPQDSPLRLRLRDDGEFAPFWRIREDLYPRRFTNFQQFAEDFYGRQTPPSDHRFQLTSPDASKHW